MFKAFATRVLNFFKHRREAWHYMGSIALLLAACHSANADDLAAQVKSAWKKRTAATKSFEYRVTTKNTRMVIVQGEVDPLFGGPVDKNFVRQPVELQTEFVFRYSSGKFLSSETGDYWNEDKKIIQQRTLEDAYDGTDETYNYSGAAALFPYAKLTRNADFNEMYLSRIVDYYPIWFAYAPIELLERISYKPEMLRVSGRKVSIDKTECIEVRVPLAPKEARGHETEVYVDPARDYIPVKFGNDKSNLEITMSYVPNARVGWVPSGWVIKLYNRTHNVEETRAGKIKSVSINGPLDARLLTIQLPPGTKLEEDNGGIKRFYIMQPDGTKKQVDPAEWRGKHDDASTSAGLPLPSVGRRL